MHKTIHSHGVSKSKNKQIKPKYQSSDGLNAAGSHCGKNMYESYLHDYVFKHT